MASKLSTTPYATVRVSESTGDQNATTALLDFDRVLSTTETSEVSQSVLAMYHIELDVSVQIALYVAIFLLAVIGNSLVILTLVQNQGMRTITNLFLLNLAISDLLVGVLCMPFSLVGVILKDFLFGSILCKLIPYLQAVSVSVSAWTLVAISVERYYAICHPLTSRRWQTLSHAYKMICIIWLLSGLSMAPIAIVSTLQSIRDTGRHKCREDWPDFKIERAYTIFLDVILLILPLGIMTVKYSLITGILWNVSRQGGSSTKDERKLMLETNEKVETASSSPSPKAIVIVNSLNGNSSQALSGHFSSLRRNSQNRSNSAGGSCDQTKKISRVSSRRRHPAILRQCNVAKSVRRKKRVIQMLGVVVTEFFVCWTPLYVMNTWYLFSPSEVYELIGPLGVSLIQLVAYMSSCVNPITYCFMNRGFRTAFFHVFGCNSTHTNFRSLPPRVHLNNSVKPRRKCKFSNSGGSRTIEQ